MQLRGETKSIWESRQKSGSDTRPQLRSAAKGGSPFPSRATIKLSAPAQPKSWSSERGRVERRFARLATIPQVLRSRRTVHRRHCAPPAVASSPCSGGSFSLCGLSLRFILSVIRTLGIGRQGAPGGMPTPPASALTWFERTSGISAYPRGRGLSARAFLMGTSCPEVARA